MSQKSIETYSSKLVKESTAKYGNYRQLNCYDLCYETFVTSKNMLLHIVEFEDRRFDEK